MKLVSFNVNGLRAVLQKNFIQDFYSFDADIFRGHGTIDQLLKNLIIVRAQETSFTNAYCYLQEIIFDKDV